MTDNSNFGRDRTAPKTDLAQWMLNQQRQFQEFDRSFGLPSAFDDPFDPFFASNFPSIGGSHSLLFSQPGRASGSLMSPGRFSVLKLCLGLNIVDSSEKV